MMLKKILGIIILSFMLLSTQVLACDNGCAVSYNDGVYCIIVNGSLREHSFKVVTAKNLVTNKYIHDFYKPVFTINGGFFDPKNQKTISYIYSDGKLSENPLDNENLTRNPAIMSNWDKIKNRAEFRIMSDGHNTYYDIENHDCSYKFGLVSSIQAGPMLLPNLELEKEGFIVKDSKGHVIRESASVLKKTERTLIGIKGNNIYIFIVTSKHPMNIYDSRTLCQKYNLDKAMAFDGGSSTSFDYMDRYHVVSTGNSGDNTGRRLKSFLIFK